MQTRIRHIARKNQGIVTESDKTLTAQSITIGRATDQDIFLADTGVGYHHARINLLPDGAVSVTAISKIGFYIEGKLVQNCLIRRKGEIGLGVFRIGIEIDSQQSLVDITVERTAQDIVELHSGKTRPTRLEETWLSKRALSWFGFAAILIIFLGLPLLGFHDGEAERMFDEMHLPGDEAWLSGEISAPHQHFGNDCNRCHQQPFVRVENRACAACHTDITVHADPGRFNLPELNANRCAGCHREHDGSEHLVQTNQLLCADCHRSLSSRVRTGLADASDFKLHHAEFRPRLITAAGLSRDNPAAWQRISLTDPGLRHETGLVFPHDVHLDPGGVDGPLGNRVMVCVDCHRSDATGNYMLPIRMEDHCQSCHRLEFDPRDLERELPHSDLRNLRKMLDEYYSLVALRGDYADDGAPDLITERRRPGKSLTPEEREIALKWALQKADKVAREVVEFRSCNLCHKVARAPDSEFGWSIPEVNTAQSRWLPKGDFDHHSHRGVECADCHAAATSAHSEDVLLPRIAVCRECHGGQQAVDQLRSSCIDCHQFHQPGHFLMHSGVLNPGLAPDG